MEREEGQGNLLKGEVKKGLVIHMGAVPGQTWTVF